MRFIFTLFLFICFHSYAATGEKLRDGAASEFHLTLSKPGQPDADPPISLRGSMVIARYSIVKKIAGVSMLPGTALILSCYNNMPVPVMAAAGIHVKKYLRHIYPAMHFW